MLSVLRPPWFDLQLQHDWWWLSWGCHFPAPSSSGRLGTGIQQSHPPRSSCWPGSKQVSSCRQKILQNLVTADKIYTPNVANAYYLIKKLFRCASGEGREWSTNLLTSFLHWIKSVTQNTAMHASYLRSSHCFLWLSDLHKKAQTKTLCFSLIELKAPIT